MVHDKVCSTRPLVLPSVAILLHPSLWACSAGNNSVSICIRPHHTIPFPINLGREMKQNRMSKPRRADLINGKLSSPSVNGSQPWLPTRKILGASKKYCLMPFQTSKSVARDWHPDMSSCKVWLVCVLTVLDCHCCVRYSPAAMQRLLIAVTSPVGEHRL